jgi:hypothetical protein
VNWDAQCFDSSAWHPAAAQANHTWIESTAVHACKQFVKHHFGAASLQRRDDKEDPHAIAASDCFSGTDRRC